MSEPIMGFPAPTKPQTVFVKKEKAVVQRKGNEFGKLTLDYSGSAPNFFFETEDDRETEEFTDLLSLLNYFGSAGWSVAFKEQNDTIYLQRNSGGIQS